MREAFIELQGIASRDSACFALSALCLSLCQKADEVKYEYLRERMHNPFDQPIIGLVCWLAM